MKFIRNLIKRRKQRGKKDSIRRLFFDRSELFGKLTLEILNRMENTVKAIEEIIQEKETFKSGGILQWGDVSLVASDTDNPLIIMIGSVSFPTGSVVELATGEKVTVTQDTQEYFSPRIIRIGIPLNLAKSSKEEIKQYLKKTEELQKQESQEFLKTLTESLISNDVQPPTNKEEKKLDGITTIDDFDLTQLTEDQRKQLQLSQKIGQR